MTHSLPVNWNLRKERKRENLGIKKVPLRTSKLTFLCLNHFFTYILENERRGISPIEIRGRGRDMKHIRRVLGVSEAVIGSRRDDVEGTRSINGSLEVSEAVIESGRGVLLLFFHKHISLRYPTIEPLLALTKFHRTKAPDDQEALCNFCRVLYDSCRVPRDSGRIPCDSSQSLIA